MSYKSNFFTKLTHWEYWPTWLVYLPVVFYYFLLSLRARSFFFFTLANPDMEMGGLYNCSKYRQLSKLPDALKPKTIFLQTGSSLESASNALSLHGINYPIIAKPDRGERGTAVKVIGCTEQLENYLRESQSDVLLQEFIQSPFEAGVFYYRLPGDSSGHIPSIVLKDFLNVIGNGKSNLKDLVNEIPRGRLVSAELFKDGQLDSEEVLAFGKEKLLEPIGNHNRGTKFLDGTHFANPELVQVFDKISHQLGAFFYGRVDLKAPSMEDFIQGKGIKILEINGVNAEPAHIYDPNAKLFDGIVTLLKHWAIIYQISRENKHLAPYNVSIKEAWDHYKRWKKVKKIA